MTTSNNDTPPVEEMPSLAEMLWPAPPFDYRPLNTFAVREKSASDGSSASYYELPEGAKELQDIIAYKNMNAQIGEIFRACMRYGQVEHSPQLRDIKKIIFYAKEELKRLEKYGDE